MALAFAELENFLQLPLQQRSGRLRVLDYPRIIDRVISVRVCLALIGWLLVLSSPASGRTAPGAHTQQRPPAPRPFPTPSTETDTTAERPPAEVDRAPQSASTTRAREEAPTETTLGVPIYPNAQHLTSYDAGRGQRFYLFGTNTSFQDMVSYYSVRLRKRGHRVFDAPAPATHTFEVGRFRKEHMAFPPGVTIKDYTWNALGGYLNPALGAIPDRFKTLIQVVTAPPVEARR